MEPTRDRAWETLTRYTKTESLLRHALAVEASTAAYAQRSGEDEELWRVAALLHDFDYEMHPTLDKHPQDGAPILRDEGYPEEVVETVLSHAEHLGLLPVQAKARGGIVIAVATDGDELVQSMANHTLWVPETPWMLSPVVTVLPLQLLAYHIASLRGLDVDHPRNLVKAVTRE